MAFWNIPSSVAVVYSDGKVSGIDNDQGSIRGGGNISSTALFSATTFGEGNPVTTVVSGVHNQAPLPGPGVFNTQDHAVIARVTTTFATNITNTAIEGGASDSANGDSIHQLAVLRTRYYKTAVRAGNWNEFSGSWSSDPDVATSGGWNIASSVDNAGTLKASGTDEAANPTSTKPGELVYFIGNPIPTQDDYKARYNW